MALDLSRMSPYKALAYSEKIWDILLNPHGRYLPSPVEWAIYPTNDCQRECSFCIMDSEKKANQTALAPQLMREIPLWAKEWRVKLLTFVGGGEPLLHPETARTISGAYHKGVPVSLVTNGILLDPGLADYVTYLRVSLDAGTPETYKRISGVDLFDRVIDNLIHYNTRRKVCYRSGDLGLSMIVTKENVEDIVPFSVIAATVGADFVHIRPAWLPKGLEPALWKSAILLCQEAQKSVPALPIHYSDAKFECGSFDKCRATPLRAVTKATGEFCLCLDRTDLTFGNLTLLGPQKSWGNDDHIRLLKNIDRSKCPRCVFTHANEIIERAFVNQETKLELI